MLNRTLIGTDRVNWPAAALAVLSFLLLGFLTGSMHDSWFLSHTSIQDNIEVCSGNDDCWTEDGVMAYTSHAWAFLGNSVMIVLFATRLIAALFIYVQANKIIYRIQILFIILLPSAMSLLAILEMPSLYYQTLRYIVFICCGFLAVGSWQLGAKIIAAPLGLLALSFNPILQLQLTKNVWAIIDVTSAIFLTALAAAFYWNSRGEGSPVGNSDDLD